MGGELGGFFEDSLDGGGFGIECWERHAGGATCTIVDGNLIKYEAQKKECIKWTLNEGNYKTTI